MTIILLVSAAVAGVGFLSIQLGRNMRVRREQRAIDIERREELDREQQRLDQELRLKEAEMQREREAEEEAEAELLRREEDARIRRNPINWARERMIITYLSPSYTAAGRVADRAEATYTAISAEIAGIAQTLTIGLGLTKTLIVIWAVTVTANIAMTGIVLWSLMGWLTLITAPGLVLAPSGIVGWVRSHVDRYRREEIHLEKLQRSIVIAAAAMILVGGVLIANADSRAAFIYDSKISASELAIKELESEDDPDTYEIGVAQALLEQQKMNRERTASTFAALLPIFLFLECLGAFYLSEHMAGRRLSDLEFKRDDAAAARDGARDAQQEMTMATRVQIVERLVQLGIYDDRVLTAIGLTEEIQDGDGQDDDDDGAAPNNATGEIRAIGGDSNPFDGWREDGGLAEGRRDEDNQETRREFPAPQQTQLMVMPAIQASPQASDGTDNQYRDFIVD